MYYLFISFNNSQINYNIQINNLNSQLNHIKLFIIYTL